MCIRDRIYSEENPAKSCKDIFTSDPEAKSGNYSIRTSDGEVLQVILYCMYVTWYLKKSKVKNSPFCEL